MLKHLAATFIALAALPALAAPVAGVTSGNTLTVTEGSRTFKIRVAYIDAPEPGHPYSSASRQSLANLCGGKDAQYKILYTDHQKQQFIAVVHCNGINAARHQVANGMAWIHGRFSVDDALPSLQASARQQRLGIWRDGTVTPPEKERPNAPPGRSEERKNTTD